MAKQRELPEARYRNANKNLLAGAAHPSARRAGAGGGKKVELAHHVRCRGNYVLGERSADSGRFRSGVAVLVRVKDPFGRMCTF